MDKTCIILVKKRKIMRISWPVAQDAIWCDTVTGTAKRRDGLMVISTNAGVSKRIKMFPEVSQEYCFEL